MKNDPHTYSYRESPRGRLERARRVQGDLEMAIGAVGWSGTARCSRLIVQTIAERRMR